MKYTYEVRGHFDAAHHLPGYIGKCSRVHGHRWTYLVVLDIPKDAVLPDCGIFVDFGAVKQVAEIYDHRDLNDCFTSPTAEVIVTAITAALLLLPLLPEDTAVTVTLWESPECSVKCFAMKGDVLDEEGVPF